MIPWTPSLDKRRTHLPEAGEVLQGFDDWVNGLKAHLPTSVSKIKPELYIKEAEATLKLRATPPQEQAAQALISGQLVEMATGEGKTLAIALAAAHMALKGKALHIFTANDYLARRDAKTMSAFYSYLGLNCHSVTSDMKAEDRKRAYTSDIVYTTAKEALADHLRDRLQIGARWNEKHRGPEDLKEGASPISPVLTRGLHYVIIDEADQMLIDEAVTPLILSRQEDDRLLETCCQDAWNQSQDFLLSRDFLLRENQVQFTQVGQVKLQSTPTGVIGNRSWQEHYLKQALHCREAIHRDEHYVVKDDKIVIVDTETGRLAEGRQWSLGIHRMLELKEGLKASDPTRPLTSMSFQEFFRRIPHLCGISGTLLEGKVELWKTYRCKMTQVPLYLPSKKKVHSDLCHLDNGTMFQAIVQDCLQAHRRGQPVLIGTRTIAESESLAEALRSEGIMPQVLNAVRHEEEASIIRQAGWKSKVTIATNMAGRGSDIPVGEEVQGLGGLLLIQVGRNPDPRQDRQLQGRTGRQGQPGEVIPHLSLEDPLLRRGLPNWFLSFIKAFPNFLTLSLLPWTFRRAQANLQKKSRQQRSAILQREHWQRQHLPNSSQSSPVS